MKQQLSIVMATYDDSKGVITTIQNIRLNNVELLERIKFVVVDNHPGTPHSTEIQNFLGWMGAGHRYIPMESPVGTSAPRNLAMASALTDWRMCIDSHVYFPPGAISKVLDYIDANPESNDLLSGPILKDDLTVMATHFQDVWNENMWGIWGLDEKGINPENPPFEIPAMGLGLFLCHGSAWNHVGGFSEKFKGFGGEEFYIHKKFYRAGYRCLCLPFLKWWHDFHRVTTPYPASMWNIARNYVIGHDELGLPFDNIIKTFVDTGKVPRNEWLQLIANPSNPPELPNGITPQFVAANMGNPNPLAPEQVNPQPPARFRLVLGNGPNNEKRIVEVQSVPPSLLQQGWNAAKALGSFIADGLTTVSTEEYERRLSICDTCEHRADNRCNLCGCFLELKAKGRAFDCPANKWNQSTIPDQQLTKV